MPDAGAASPSQLRSKSTAMTEASTPPYPDPIPCPVPSIISSRRWLASGRLPENLAVAKGLSHGRIGRPFAPTGEGPPTFPLSDSPRGEPVGPVSYHSPRSISCTFSRFHRDRARSGRIGLRSPCPRTVKPVPFG